MQDFFAEIFADGIHLTSKGRNLISLVRYACIHKESPQGKVSAPTTGLTKEQAAIFQRIAWDALKNYKWAGVAAATTRKKGVKNIYWTYCDWVPQTAASLGLESTLRPRGRPKRTPDRRMLSGLLIAPSLRPWPIFAVDKPELLVIRNPAARLDHAQNEIVTARYYDIPVDAIKQHGQPVA